MPPLSLYVHIPWCVQKCPYCDFNSHPLRQAIDETAYVQQLLADLQHQLPQVWGRRLHSIFIGGGTPSLFSADAIDQLLTGVRSLLPFSGDIEVTLEANPGTAEAEKFRGFRQAGVNRLSIGIQSFAPDQLKKLGRIHDREEAIRAVEYAHAAGFDSFNLDLMHGLPGQTPAQAMADLQQAFELQPPHLSWYQLTLEPNTLFYQQPPTLPADDDLWAIQEQGQQALAEAGLIQYETSAYSRSKGLRSQHNLNYWTFGDYLGIGAGAHGKLTFANDGRIWRYSKLRHPKAYLAAAPEQLMQQQQDLSDSELPFEFMMNALRLMDGVPLRLFSERTGLPYSFMEATVNKAVKKELLLLDSGWLKPTELGQRFLNDLLQLFLDVSEPERQPAIKITQLD